MSKKAASSAYVAGTLTGVLATFYGFCAYIMWRLTHSPRQRRP